jgi:hypothetical protein
LVTAFFTCPDAAGLVFSGWVWAGAVSTAVGSVEAWTGAGLAVFLAFSDCDLADCTGFEAALVSWAAAAGLDGVTTGLACSGLSGGGATSRWAKAVTDIPRQNTKSVKRLIKFDIFPPEPVMLKKFLVWFKSRNGGGAGI